MNPILKEAIGSILRKLLTGWAVWLVAKGYWTNAEVTVYVEAAIVAIFSLALTAWKIYGDRVWKMVALTMPVGATEDDVKAKIKSGAVIPTITTPSNTQPGVPKLPLLFLFISITLVGCTTVFTGIVTVTDVVDSAMKNWAQLSADNKTTPDFDAKVLKAHDKYRESAAIAQASLILYQQTKNAADLDAALRAARTGAKPLIDLIAYILIPSDAAALQTKLTKASKP